ncbi:MAG: hypothetical protein WD397_03780 [Wenzhouxiangellaceae bacterium]
MILVLCAANAGAQTRQIERYTYDEAGNIIGIEVATVDGPPQISAIEPDRVFAGDERRFTITGANLSGVSVSLDRAELTVSGVETEDATVELTLAASADIESGLATITLSSSAGSAAVDIEVRPALPRLLVDPLPPVLSPGGELQLDLALAEPAAAAWLLEIGTDDPAIASAGTDTIQLVEGQVSIPEGLVLTGGSTGSTRLRISTEGAVLLDTGVIVAEAAELEPGDWEFFARPLGLRKLRPVALTEFGPIAGLLKVRREFEPVIAELPADVAAAPLRIVRGAALTGLNPEVLDRNAGSATLTLIGTGLVDVNEVSITPPDGIEVLDLAAAADGESVAVELQIDPDAEVGLRRVEATAAGVRVHPVVPKADRFYLGGDLPRIDSIDPVVANPDSTVELTVRGTNFSSTSTLAIDPPDGIVIDEPVYIAGTQERIVADVHIAAGAAIGSRRVQVTSAAGSSAQEMTPANTLELRGEALETFPLFGTRHLRIFRGSAEIPESAHLASAPLRIGKGALVTEVEPRVLETGRMKRLVIGGQGLDRVTGIAIEPGDGLLAGVPSGDDTVLEIEIEVDADAPRILHRLEVLTADGALPIQTPELAVLQVVSPLPVVEGVSPVAILPGAPAETVTISGRNFENTQAVRIIPQTDLQLGPISVSADGRQIMLDVAAAAGAETGPRVVQVETPAGESSTDASPGHQLYVGDPEERLITPLVSPLVGLERETEPVLVPRHAYAPLLGIEREFVPPVVEIEHLVAGSRTRVARGPVLFGIEPAIVPRGFDGELVIPGAELGLDVEVTIENGDGIAITGAASVEVNAQDQPFIRLPIAVDEQAPDILHRLVVTRPTADGSAPVPFGDPQAARLQVAGAAPVIESIEPIVTLPDRRFPLLIRGLNFQQASAVRVVPDQGIAVGTDLTINEAGTELTVNLDVGENAEPGPRLIQLVSPAGESSDTATAANTLTVVEP